MTKSKIAALLASLALGACAAGCSTATNENMNKPANMAPANTTKPANMAPPTNANTKMPPPPKASATKKP